MPNYAVQPTLGMSKTGPVLQAAWRCVAAVIAVVTVAASTLGATITAGSCAGDCDDDGTVVVAELIRGVRIALGFLTVEACPQYDCSAPVCADIQVVIAAVENALYGCPTTPGPTPTAQLPTITPMPGTSTAALERVIADQCTWNCPAPFFQAVTANQQGYVVDCNCPSGHSSRVELIRHASNVEAMAAFLDATTDRSPIAFHDLPAAYWLVPYDTTTYGGAYRHLIWQLGCWVISAHSFDDTHFEIAAQPVPFSEAILVQAGEFLVAECDSGG
jgi:hypothetical protein